MSGYIIEEDESFAERSRTMKNVKYDNQRRLEARQEAGVQCDDASTEVSAEPNLELAFVDNEMRGYKLLKNAVLSHGGRQAGLAIVRTDAGYLPIRDGLKGCWEDDELKRRDAEKY